MVALIPEPVNFKISTTDVDVRYTERNGVIVKLEVLMKDDYVEGKNFTTVEIRFNVVAELKCVSLNFLEAQHNNYEIFKNSESKNEYEFWLENSFHPNSGLYRVDNSTWLLNSKSMYDPKNRLELKHYLILGYDSYSEILASSYSINV